MTTLALTQYINRTPVFLQKIGNAVSAFFDGVNDARELSHRFDALSRLSDAQLAQRGLKREDIAHAVLATGRPDRR